MQEVLKSSSPRDTAGVSEQPTPSGLGDLREDYVMRPPTSSSMRAPLENRQSDEEPGSLGPSTLPGALRSDVPVYSILRIPERAVSPYRFELLQMWEGTVTDVGEGEFKARLTDITDPSRPDEEADFSRREVFDGDLALLVEGAVFRWSIGYKTRGGTKERVSHISFLRLPAWSGKTAEAVREAAAELGRPGPIFRPSEQIRRAREPGLAELVVGRQPIETTAALAVFSPTVVRVVHARVRPQQKVAVWRPADLDSRQVFGSVVEPVLSGCRRWRLQPQSRRQRERRDSCPVAGDGV